MHLPSLPTLPHIPHYARGGGFSPAILFALAEPGIWLDPSDTSTLFADTAGTTQATYGQAVALVLDKSGNGNNATQPTAAARPILARVPETGRRNLLTRTEEFENAAWAKVSASVSSNAATAPDGTITADRLVENTDTNQHIVNQSISTNGEVIKASIYAKAGERTAIHIRNGNLGVSSVFDILNGVVLTQGNGQTASISDEGGGWFRCSVSFVSAVGPQQYIVGLSSSSINYLGDGVSGAFIWGAQIEVGSEATNYQRVLSQYDVTEAGVRDLNYLFFDGTDDFMVTPSIDFTSTDEMSVFAGVRNLSPSTGIIMETSTVSANNAGAMRLTASNPGATRVTYSAGGTTRVALATPSIFPPPVTYVLTGTNKIATPIITIRANGVEQNTSASSQGTGNMGNYPMYIGSRAGSSAPLTGHLFSLIVRGALTEADVIDQVETYVADKTAGVTL